MKFCIEEFYIYQDFLMCLYFCNSILKFYTEESHFTFTRIFLCVFIFAFPFWSCIPASTNDFSWSTVWNMFFFLHISLFLLQNPLLCVMPIDNFSRLFNLCLVLGLYTNCQKLKLFPLHTCGWIPCCLRSLPMPRWSISSETWTLTFSLLTLKFNCFSRSFYISSFGVFGRKWQISYGILSESFISSMWSCIDF